MKVPIPRAPNHCRERNDCGGAEKVHNITSTFFNTVHLLCKNLRFEHGGAKLASCPGSHLTLSRSCLCEQHSATNALDMTSCSSAKTTSRHIFYRPPPVQTDHQRMPWVHGRHPWLHSCVHQWTNSCARNKLSIRADVFVVLGVSLLAQKQALQP